MNSNQRVQRFFSAISGTWPSRIYLAAAFALLTWVAVDTMFVDHADASFAAVIPMLFTAPTSLVVLLLPEGSAVAYFAAVAVAAVINAALLGLAVRALRGGAARPAQA
ncbi:hypothetical protein GCM10009716_01820 [Streptomyces sodiiphilus]|uniref:Uncharacterized protein n=1 Tax=Streptomyces sodiiphilus TaxID=226217 RepID=A0ABP5A067_9ACTN